MGRLEMRFYLDYVSSLATTYHLNYIIIKILSNPHELSSNNETDMQQQALICVLFRTPIMGT